MHSSGFSTGVQCPQPRSTSTRLPEIFCAIMRTDCGGATTSSSPVTSSVGQAMRRGVGGLRVGQRLAAPRVAVRVLPHQRLAHEGDRHGSLCPGLSRRTCLHQRIGDAAAFPPARAFARTPADIRPSPDPAARAAARTARGCAPSPARQPRGAPRRWSPWNARRRAPCRPWQPPARVALLRRIARSKADLPRARSGPNRAGRGARACGARRRRSKGVQVFEVPPRPWIISTASPSPSTSIAIRSTKTILLLRRRNETRVSNRCARLTAGEKKRHTFLRPSRPRARTSRPGLPPPAG